MTSPHYDRCPDCASPVTDPDPADLGVHDEIECPACPWKGTVGELTTQPYPRADALVPEKGYRVAQVFESPAYPSHMLRKFREIQRRLPIGAVVDPLGMGPAHYLVVLGLEMTPVFEGDGGNDEYFALHTARLHGGTFYRSSRMSFEELTRYAEQVVGFLAELVPHNATEAGL